MDSQDLQMGRGVYDTRRAAALAGIPASTLHYWARTRLYEPSVSPEPRTRLWSWADLVALRAIDFFRRGLTDTSRKNVSVPKIREAVQALARHGYVQEQLPYVLAANASGELFSLDNNDDALRADATNQLAMKPLMSFVRPYMGGPDLRTPRPRLRILPGKLQGEPHIHNTRIPSATIYALHQSGYEDEQILRFYPEITRDDITEALDLERSLTKHAA